MLLSLCVLGLACAREPGAEYDPRPLRMVPGWGLNSGPVAVVIEGENFRALATQHIGGQEPVSVDARFQAFLGEVALEDVTLEDTHTLRARVPEGLAPGWHTLAVVGPLGRHVELPRAWFASERPLALLQGRGALALTRVEVGARVRLLLTVENVGSTAALGVVPVLSALGEGRVERLSEPTPANIIPGGSVAFAWELLATAPGEVGFSVEAVGNEQELGLELRMSGVDVGRLEIRPTPGSLTARFFPVPERVDLGKTFDIALEVTNPGGHPVRGVRPEAMGSSGTGGVTLIMGPEPASADIPAGGSVVFRGRLMGVAEGPCTFRAGARGVEQSRGVTVVALPVESSLVRVQRPEGAPDGF